MTNPMSTPWAPWTREMGISLCREMEVIAPSYGAHVALTGGLLYRDGPRKDCDILVYRVRQVRTIDWAGLFRNLQLIGIHQTNDYGWCKKCLWNGLPLDLFDAESDGEYGAYGDFEPVLKEPAQ